MKLKSISVTNKFYQENLQIFYQILCNKRILKQKLLETNRILTIQVVKQTLTIIFVYFQHRWRHQKIKNLLKIFKNFVRRVKIKYFDETHSKTRSSHVRCHGDQFFVCYSAKLERNPFQELDSSHEWRNNSSQVKSQWSGAPDDYSSQLTNKRNVVRFVQYDAFSSTGPSSLVDSFL